MRQVKRSALVPYSAMQMYELVADVERYPAFLPWCTGAEVLERHGELVTARLALRRAGASARFTTRNRLVAGDFLEMRLLEGPFRSLEGRWDFKAIGTAGSRVQLEIRFETMHSLAGLLLGPAFEGACNQLVDAFGQRARQVYGGT
jgi:ribosome-associated toxin RatA of RatAB toxin-antitoxin module